MHGTLDTRRRIAVRGREVALPDARRARVKPARVAGGTEMEAAVRDRVVDRPGRRVVLERAFGEVEDVVHDDVRPRLAERFDVRREPLLAAERGGEVEMRARRQIVDDLQHRRPLVPVVARLAGQHRHVGRQVARRLPVRQRLDAVRQHADADAGAVDPETLARRCRTMSDVALGGVLLLGPVRFRFRCARVARRTPDRSPGDATGSGHASRD